MKYKLGIDVGGTFTDFVLVDEDGNLKAIKTISTYENPEEAIYMGLTMLAQRLGMPIERLLENITLIIHSSTVCDNALIQMRIAKTGLITTKGFRDVLEHREGRREEIVNYYIPLPPMLVPRRLRLEVEERVSVKGEELIPLNEADASRAVKRLKEAGVKSVSICLLHSYANPAHEKMLGEIVKEKFPEAYVSLSHKILPMIGEYVRKSTTTVNACLGPLMEKYIDGIENLLRSTGYGGLIRYTQSNGGLSAAELIKRNPVLAIHSGPCTAPAAGLFYSSLLKQNSVITIDIGGTSFDTSLVTEGQVYLEKDFQIYRFRIGTPVVNINCIGAGGGSIAWIDPGGMLKVGPQSAEAIPGPACYMRGGAEATVTDAHVALGRFNQFALLGGEFKIDSQAAKEAIREKVAKPLNMTLDKAALGILKIANSNMVGAIRAISVEKGLDPRDYTMVVGGGCGGAHCAELARELDIHTILVPRIASVLCAFGALASPIRHDYNLSFPAKLSEEACERFAEQFQQIEQKAYRDLYEEGVSKEEVRIERFLAMKYHGEPSELLVPVGHMEISKNLTHELEELLHQEHEKEYTFRDTERGVELIGLQVTAFGPQPTIKVKEQTGEGTDPLEAEKELRPVLFEEYSDYVETPIYDGNKIRPGMVLKGPAIVEELTTTIVVIPGFNLQLDGRDFFIMTFDG